tara:strand:+ start:824 stop:1108 length:285 start_codon:yes stop_codon:yes gene_type:complete
MKHYINNETKEVFAYEADGSQDEYIKSGLVPITDSDLETLREQQEQARLDALTYSENRAEEYPSIADQLDDLYHNGIDGWKITIKAIKDKHPKE